MGEREEWRFQWPDGTWIHWNPQTQSWEKETPAGSTAVVTPDPEPPVADDVIEERLPEAVAPPELHEEEETEAVVEEGSSEPAREEPFRHRRSMVGDVLPPQPEPNRPGGRLWPTILAGALIGVAVGLLLWSYIR